MSEGKLISPIINGLEEKQEAIKERRKDREEKWRKIITNDGHGAQENY